MVEAAALRLHSLTMGVERMLLLVSRVVKGGTPSHGEDWHRRLLERTAKVTESRATRSVTVQKEHLFQVHLRFRHLVRNLYADDLRAETIKSLIVELRQTWPRLIAELQAFKAC